ncbi:MAG: hypothetical protein QOJ56_6034 [Mycobacterium sp.]|nr:hypothetical protein [Mycobacterium sp.]
MAQPMSSHDPGKIVLDLAVALAVGGDCLADIGVPGRPRSAITRSFTLAPRLRRSLNTLPCGTRFSRTVGCNRSELLEC